MDMRTNGTWSGEFVPKEDLPSASTGTRISAESPDWLREHKSIFAWNPSKSLLASIRSYQRHAASRSPVSVLLRKVAVLRYRWWSAITGAEIPIHGRIGGGLLTPHPNGIVIHPRAVVGPNCLIMQQVTIGTRSDESVPIIGGNVDIGAGAKILGAVTIGDHVRVGANAVVLHDVPAGATVVGVPAVIVERRA